MSLPIVTIDNLMRADLKYWSDLWFHVLKVSTIFVAVGVGFEGPEVLHEAIPLFRHGWRVAANWWHLKRKKTDFCGWNEVCPELNIIELRKDDNKPKLIVVLGFIGWIFVVGGVAGEGIAETILGDADTNLQAFNNGLLADARKETAIAILQASINTMESAKLQSENLKLEAEIAPRLLTQEQRVKIADNCARFKALSKGKRIKVVSYTLDSEGLVFAEQIVNVLRGSGLFVDDDAMTVTPVQTVVFGMNVFGSDSELAKALATAIGSSGKPIAVGFVKTDPTAGAVRFEYSHPPDQATILVGLKPFDADTENELRKTMKQRTDLKP